MLDCKKKRGMSIVDVIVSIGIFSLGIAGFTALFADTWKTNSFVLEEGQSVGMASRAVGNTVKELRKTRQADNGSYMIKTADDFSLVVYMNDDSDEETERVHYFLEDEKLKKGVTNPSGSSPVTYPAADEIVTIVSNYVMNTPAQPVFYYYNENYPGDIVNNPLGTPASVGDIKLIKIVVWINIKPLTAPDNVRMESFVNLRNLNEYNI